MIPEREREALMRLTMCAREECSMCKYQGDCNFDFQYELATKNMNILADALRADRKTEPKGNCKACKWWGSYGYCVHKECKGFEPKAEPQADCHRCIHFTTDKCRECFGKELFIDSGYITKLNEPKTDCSWK